MSYKETIIQEINELFRVPAAFICLEGVYKVVSWGACKSYLSWPDGAPEGWDDLPESTEFFVGRSGKRLVTVEVANDSITKLYAHSESSVEDAAEHICWTLDLPDDEDNECDDMESWD